MIQLILLGIIVSPIICQGQGNWLEQPLVSDLANEYEESYDTIQVLKRVKALCYITYCTTEIKIFKWSTQVHRQICICTEMHATVKLE